MQYRSEFNTGGPRRVGPWAANWAGIRGDFSLQAHGQSDHGGYQRRNRVRLHPQVSRRRIQAIGVAASSAVAAVWIVALTWWQIAA